MQHQLCFLHSLRTGFPGHSDGSGKNASRLVATALRRLNAPNAPGSLFAGYFLPCKLTPCGRYRRKTTYNKAHSREKREKIDCDSKMADPPEIRSLKTPFLELSLEKKEDFPCVILRKIGHLSGYECGFHVHCSPVPCSCFPVPIQRVYI